MVGGENIAAVFLLIGNQASISSPMASLSSQRTALTPPWKTRSEPKTLLQLFRLHTGLNLQRVESVHTTSTSSGTKGTMSPQECRWALTPRECAHSTARLWTGFRSSLIGIQREELESFYIPCRPTRRCCQIRYPASHICSYREMHISR